MLQLFAQRNSDEVNSWLSRNPIVLGAGALVIGLILVGLGVSALMSGKATTKRGHKLTGGQAHAMGFVWLGFGVLCILFALFKIVSGVM